jgi:hypothetical protein
MTWLDITLALRSMAAFKAMRKLQWTLSGKPLPPPNCVKEEALLSMRKKHGLSILVETGTFLGETVYAMRRKFRHIYSIELDENLYKRAKGRFAKYGHVTILHGDSGQKLPEVLGEIGHPALFWLDGHYCGGLSAQADRSTPIVQELKYVFGHSVKGHVMVIDDARLFTGQGGYPDLEYIRKTFGPDATGYTMDVKSDMIFLVPKVPRNGATVS